MASRKTTTPRTTTPKTARSTLSLHTDPIQDVEEIVATSAVEPSIDGDAEAELNVVDVLKKKEFIDTVAEASGVKRGDTKKVIEAALMLLGDTIQSGKELNLPPLGKISINRQKETENAHVVIAKLRRSKGMVANALSEDTNDNEPSEEFAPES